MQILHVYKDYFPVVGGIENHIKLLAEAQAARGHAVSVLVTSRDHRTHIETRNGVRVIFAARLATISSAPISLALFDLLRREIPDVAHLQFPYPIGETANFFCGRARKTVISYQSDIVRQKYLRVIYAPLMRCVLARADRIIASSPNYIRSSPILSQWKDKCAVVPLGIDLAPFENATVEELGIFPPSVSRNPQHVSLLFVGHLRYYKGLDYLIQALRELPRAHLIVVGAGPMEREWRALTQQLGVEARVAFVGEVSDAELPAYYAAADIFILPASERSEAFGAVQLEAMAAGKPVVCTELGTGTSFVNVDGETGFVVPARDSHALAAALARLMDDATLRARMGAAGRARVRREFTLEKMVDRVMAVYAM
jgi:rhamnosyl/mannosyltransferase